MSRATIRTGIASFFGGATYDEQAQIYRPTVLAASGLAGVRPYWAKEFRDSDYFATLAAGSVLGAVMCVHLPGQAEKRVAMGGVITGVKSLVTSVELWVFHRAQTQYPETAQAHLDDLLDAVVNRIHADRTLGGAVIEAGEGGGLIRVSTGLPVVEPSTRILQEAVISFDAVVYPNA